MSLIFVAMGRNMLFFEFYILAPRIVSREFIRTREYIDTTPYQRFKASTDAVPFIGTFMTFNL